MPPRPTSTASESPRLYRDLAGWFHLLTAPHEYRDEAHYYGERILEAASGQVRTVLELGSGGGNNASHMKRRFTMTLSDLSPEMLALSQRINPGARARPRRHAVPENPGRTVRRRVRARRGLIPRIRRRRARHGSHSCLPLPARRGRRSRSRPRPRELRPAVRGARRPRRPRRARHAFPHVDHRPRSRRLDLHCRLRLPAPRLRWDCPRRARPARLRHLPRVPVDRCPPATRVST